MGARSLDRRFWFRLDVASACLGVLLVALADSLVERIAYVAFTAYWIVDAAARARRIKRDGRWIEPPDQDGRGRDPAVMIGVIVALFFVGLIIGLSS